MTADPSEELLNSETLNRPLSILEQSIIFKCFHSNPMFSSFSRANIKKLFKKFSIFSYTKQKIVFAEGQAAYFFYIVSSGSVEVLIKGQQKDVISKSGCFGEHALFHDSKRLVTARTLENSVLLALGREVFKFMIKSVTMKKISKNREFLDQIPLFASLTHEQKESILNLLIVHKFNPGQRIVREKDTGDLLYIIKKGSAVVSVDGIKKRQLGPGDFFGEQALIYKNYRSASVDSSSKLSLLSLKSEDFFKIFDRGLESLIYQNSIRISLEKSEILKKLEKNHLESLIKSTKIKKLNEGEIFINEGQAKGQALFIVLKGEVMGEESFNHLEVIGAKDIYEESQEKFCEDWIAICSTDLGVIEKDEIEKAIGGKLADVIQKTEILKVMKRIQILRTLSTAAMEALILAMKVESFPSGAVIFEQGSPAQSFYIIQEGQVEVIIDSKVVREIGRHDFFGERGILFNECRTATVISKEATCWVLTKDDFLDLIAKSQRRNILKRIKLQNDEVELADLSILHFLGRGMFGVVFLALNPKTRIKYALKVILKSKIEEFDLAAEILLEKQVLMLIDHPFIVKLVKSFEDSDKVYFLLEYVEGQDLFDIMRQVHINCNEPAMFYISNLILILEHLHEMKIIYRDLKPENVMVDSNGFCKLIDFGTAKIIKERTYTTLGTAQYMAPEVIQGIGYGLEVDYWSLGVILYEMMCNMVPFGEGLDDPFMIYASILKGELVFPSYVNLNECKGLIEKLLSKNPVFRGNYESIKKHPWFSNVDWEMILSQDVKPPYKPKISRKSKDIVELNIDEFM